MQIIECRKGEGLVIGDDVVVDVMTIQDDSVRFSIQMDEDASIQLCECGAQDGVLESDTEKNAA